MPEGFIQLPADSTGKKLRSYDRGTPGHDNYVIPTDERLVTYRGHASTFRIPGLAGTAGQKLLSLHNATGSSILVDVHEVTVHHEATVVKAITVLPPVIRLARLTTLPSGGAAVTKVADDTAQASNASVTLLQGASADGTGATLTAATTANAVIEESFAPRLITATTPTVDFRRREFRRTPRLVRLRALEGVAVSLDYTLATQNAATDMWLATIVWSEYSLP